MEKKIIDYLKSVLPSYWLMNEKFNKEWDTRVNYLLDNYKFTKTDGYRGTIDGVDIWVENHPYSSFTLDTKLGRYRPSRSTVAKAYRIYNRFLNEQKKIEIKKSIQNS